MNFLDAKEAFLQELRRDILISKGYFSNNTIKMYSMHLDGLGKFIANKSSTPYEKLQLKEITEEKIKQYLMKRIKSNINPFTRNTELYCFKSFFRIIHKLFHLKNEAKDINRISCNYEVKTQLLEEHLIKFMKFIHTLDVNNKFECRNKLYFLTLIRFGLRPSEGLNLNIDSFSINPHTLLLKITGKGNKTRVLPLPLVDQNDQPIERFKDYIDLFFYYIDSKRKEIKNIKDDKALFLNKNGSKLSVRSIQKTFDGYMHFLGLNAYDYTPHSLRHTFASNLVHADVPIIDVSKALGHSSPLVTANIYLHTEQNKIRKGLEKTI